MVNLVIKDNSRRDYIEVSIPQIEGRYLAIGLFGDIFPREIDVYTHPVKGLCCFTDDFGGCSEGGYYDESDCHRWIL